MRILVIGSGGREHALAWKLAASPRAERVFVAPGNAGTALEPGLENVPVPAHDADALIDFARRESVGLTVAGPEQPLVEGLVDRFEAAGLRCFGPTASAARLEGSKAFTKRFLERHSIPSAAYASFDAVEPALAHLRAQRPPYVIKADGLAAGKGVVVAPTLAEAEHAVTVMLRERKFGEAGGTVVIEEFLEGEEATFMAVVDGRRVVPLATSQDHKRRDDNDAGPNTGGMGAYSPAPVVDAHVHARIMTEIVRPTVDGLAAEGIEYRGFLYAGLMIDAAGAPRVVEFNCRFGDPEAQAVLMRLRSDLAALCLAALDGTLESNAPEWDRRAAVGVVVASRGYPAAYEKGFEISGLDTADEGVKVFHAGTKLENGGVVTDGGRVLCVTALGEDVAAARDLAYRNVAKIAFEGAFHRTDIASRAVARRGS